MRSAFEAKAHTDWMREKVAKSVAKSLDDPRPNISHKQVMTDLQAVIDAKRKKHATEAAS
jgi:hypothetical protein